MGGKPRLGAGLPALRERSYLLFFQETQVKIGLTQG